MLAMVAMSLLSLAFGVVASMAFFLSAFCGDGGPSGLPTCLTAFWGLSGCAALTLLLPLGYRLWVRRATDRRTARRRLALCLSGYLPPVLWFLGLLRFYFR